MIKKLFLLGFSLCLIVTVFEFGIRYHHLAWPFESALYVPSYLTARDITLRWRLVTKPGRNILGLKNREIAPKKADTYRILFLGDSMLFYSDTSSGATYTAVLEKRLNARLSNTTFNFEVINAGVPGYSTYQELEFLKIYGLDMKPDLVVLGFVFNDLHHPYLNRPTSKILINHEPATRLNHINPHALPGALFASSYLAHEVIGRGKGIWAIIAQRPMFPFEQMNDFYPAWESHGWIHARKLIGEMQSLLAARSVPLAVVVFPISDQIKDQYLDIDRERVLYPQRRIREICDAFKIHRLDLTNSIYRNGGIELFRDYLHLNARGNNLVADELEKFFVKNL